MGEGIEDVEGGFDFIFCRTQSDLKPVSKLQQSEIQTGEGCLYSRVPGMSKAMASSCPFDTSAH